jgi:MFS family permease
MKSACTARADSRFAPPAVRLWLIVLFGYLALGETLQVLPKMTASRFGAGPVLVGLVISVASLAAAAMRPIAGRAADTGRARTSVLAGAILGVLGGLGHLWAPNLIVLIGARLLLGSGEGALFVAAVSWVVRSVALERRGAAAGWFGLSMWAGLALGPALAVGLELAGGQNAVWAGVIGLPATGFVLALTTTPPPPPAGRKVGRRRLVPLGARVPGLTLGLASYGYGTIITSLLLRLQQGRLGGESIALTVFASAFLISRFAGSPFVTRFGGSTVAIASSLVEAAGLCVVACATTLTVAVAGIIACGAGVALLYPAAVAITVERVSADEHGAAVGVMTSFWDLAIVAAGPFGGLVASVAGYPAAFALAALPAVLAASLAFGILRSRAGGERHTSRSDSDATGRRRSQPASAHGHDEGGRPGLSPPMSERRHQGGPRRAGEYFRRKSTRI